MTIASWPRRRRPVRRPTTVEAAFGVFRRAATAQERDVRFVVPRLPEVRRIASTARADVYLAAARDRLCFSVLPSGRENGGVASCGAPQGYLDGHKIMVGTFFPRGRLDVRRGVPGRRGVGHRDACRAASVSRSR